MADRLLDVDVDVRGPLLDNRGALARFWIRRYVNELEREGVEWAYNDIKSTFHTHFRNPTGYYESKVHTEEVGGSWHVRDDGRIPYGPWLEGVGSKNAPVTRFRGYGAFRKASDRLNRRIEEMGNRIFRLRYRRRLE